MARQTYREIVAEIQRYPALAGITLGEILDTVEVVAKDIGNQPWPWNYAETNINVPASYSTGTVDVANGAATVLGNLTAWDITWYGRRIRFGNSNLDYVISSITNPTTIVLDQAVNLTANLVNSGYTIYQDTFAYPADYIIGSDVALLQPTIRARIPKIPRATFEMVMNAGMRSFSTNIQMFYCDHGEELTAGALYGRFRFRLGPPPSGVETLRLCYHKMTPDLSIANITTLPEGFDEVISLTAAARLHDDVGKGQEAERLRLVASGKMKLLKRAVDTQTIDDIAMASYELPDSSISQWGMTIARM